MGERGLQRGSGLIWVQKWHNLKHKLKCSSCKSNPGMHRAGSYFSAGLVTWAFKSFSAFEACEIHNGHKVNMLQLHFNYQRPVKYLALFSPVTKLSSTSKGLWFTPQCKRWAQWNWRCGSGMRYFSFWRCRQMGRIERWYWGELYSPHFFLQFRVNKLRTMSWLMICPRTTWVLSSLALESVLFSCSAQDGDGGSSSTQLSDGTFSSR